MNRSNFQTVNEVLSSSSSVRQHKIKSPQQNTAAYSLMFHVPLLFKNDECTLLNSVLKSLVNHTQKVWPIFYVEVKINDYYLNQFYTWIVCLFSRLVMDMVCHYRDCMLDTLMETFSFIPWKDLELML